MKTIGEKTFEEYLNSREIKYEFERRLPGKQRRPDYTIFHDREYLLEVKDLDPTDVPEGGAFDGYARIRSKIDSAAKKFQEYETYPCALVLYNNNAALVDVTKPELVLGAMYGNVGIVIPFNIETAEPTGLEYQAFLAGGKMIRPHWKEAANTRISALITLRYVEVGLMRQNEFVSKIKSTETNRVKRAADVYRQLINANFEFDREERHLGVIVWENAFGATPFPRDLFAGEFDEIYGFENGGKHRVFAGGGILEYEKIREAAKIPNLFDILKKNEHNYEGHS
jgi:hypothetical protein